MTPDAVVEEAFASLGKKPSVITGDENRTGQKFIAGIPRSEAVEIVAKHAINNF
jgi:hypothetical protein